MLVIINLTFYILGKMITPLNVLFFREEPVINNVNSPLIGYHSETSIRLKKSFSLRVWSHAAVVSITHDSSFILVLML